MAGHRIQTWSYILSSAIGGNDLVSITLVQGKMTAIESRQQKR